MTPDNEMPAPPADFRRAVDAAWWLHMAFPDVAGFSAWNGRWMWRDLPAAPGPVLTGAGALPVAGQYADGLAEARDAFLALSDRAHWGAAYGKPGLAAYELVGREGHFLNPRLRGFVFWAGQGAEATIEIPDQVLYLVVAGSLRAGPKGRSARPLAPGDVAFQAAGQPHRLAAPDGPALLWALWREVLPG
ncbi:cupin domain-containing protein [Marimonas lutisalis]|uniref:hypothetical protein n=1 Tax=Marimonas lutisalis TaxID=2545756 RepID=UPI0010F6CAFE|nr:hypothetical protein [Marimonas lutisalis]